MIFMLRPVGEEKEFIPVKDIMIEKNLYRVLTKLKYSSASSDSSISDHINNMLTEYLHTYVLSKRMGHMLVSRDIIRIAFSNLTEDQIKEASASNAIRYKDGALLEYGKPTLDAYLGLIASFAKANKFEFEVGKEPENENQVLIMSFGSCGAKFTEFKAQTYRLLLGEFADVVGLEATNTALCIKFRPKKERITGEQQVASRE